MRVGGEHLHRAGSGCAPVHGNAVGVLAANDVPATHYPGVRGAVDGWSRVHATVLQCAHLRGSIDRSRSVEADHGNLIDHIHRARRTTVVSNTHAEEVGLVLRLRAIGVPAERTSHCAVAGHRCYDGRRWVEECTVEDGSARGEQQRIRIDVHEVQIEAEQITGLYRIHTALSGERFRRIVGWAHHGLQLQITTRTTDEHTVAVLLHFHGHHIIALQGGHVRGEARGAVDERIASWSERLCDTEGGHVVHQWNSVGQHVGWVDDAATTVHAVVRDLEGEDELIAIGVGGAVHESARVVDAEQRRGDPQPDRGGIHQQRWRNERIVADPRVVGIGQVANAEVARVHLEVQMVTTEIQRQVNGAQQVAQLGTQALANGTTAGQIGCDQRTIREHQVDRGEQVFVRVGCERVLRVNTHG